MTNWWNQFLLRRGAWVWNAWRMMNPHVQLDFAGADLRGINLLWPDLHSANFEGANLSGVSLYRADLRSANLSGADLSGADLSGADLQAANLSGARLHDANLRWANLSLARLQGCEVDRAFVSLTMFAYLDLRSVQGLKTLRHDGPSAISIDTLYRSKGDIPEVFLRSCGVPDSMIEYAHSLVAAERPIDYYSCFISYSSVDAALAERLYADLQAKGVRCWLAPHDLTPGEVIVRGIDEAIRLHDKVVLLLSEAAVTSHWVAYEVNLATTREAREGRTVLYPLRLDDAVLTTRQGWAATLHEGRHIGDFQQWKDHDTYQDVFARLLCDLKAEQ